MVPICSHERALCLVHLFGGEVPDSAQQEKDSHLILLHYFKDFCHFHNQFRPLILGFLDQHAQLPVIQLFRLQETSHVPCMDAPLCP